MIQQSAALVKALLQRGVFAHPVSDMRLLETHISWVLLTGDFAYKIKKPVKLDFLDFSTLAQRLHYCETELRLNQRWAPSLYLGVVAITGTAEAPVMDGGGAAIEYALKMRQFPQSMRLDAQLEAGLVTDEDMVALASTIASQHERVPAFAPRTDDDAFAAAGQPMLDNFSHLRSIIDAHAHQALLQWTTDSLRRQRGALIQREQAGFIRECHGDLHLANLVRLDSGIQAFDCIEFSADLRRIDVISDVAFLVMDLVARGRQDLAFRFLNRYLELSGDYDGMAVFRLYCVYHCLIRAKVAAIRSLERDDPAAADEDRGEARRYCGEALGWIAPAVSCLVAMHGFSASGKTWLSGSLMSAMPAIRLRSDIERKRAVGMAERERTHCGAGEGLYSTSARAGVYRRLFEIATGLVRSGFHVILDASFLAGDDRARARKLAGALGARFALVTAHADVAELKRRLSERRGDASDADAEVLNWQRRHADPMGEHEAAGHVLVATDEPVSVSQVVERILQRPLNSQA